MDYSIPFKPKLSAMAVRYACIVIGNEWRAKRG